MKEALKILLVEDSQDDAELIQRALRDTGRDIVYRRVDSRPALISALDSEEWDAVIADFSLPSFSGLAALGVLKGRQLDIPFILVSGTIGEEVAVEAMKAGVHDYLMKNRLARLWPAVQRELKEAETRRERRKAEEALRQNLVEKEILIKEIHHRVKNNLQIICSLINLQAKRIQDQKTLEGLRDCRERVKAMALVHEKLYHAKDLAHIDFADYVQDLASGLLRSYVDDSKPIQLIMDAEKIFLGVDQAIPCGLIMDELVSNSLKHAFPSKGPGEIRVMLKRQEEKKVLLSVADNGVGFPQDKDFRNTTSLGLQLVCSLAKQLEGTIELRSGRGTEFKLTFDSLKLSPQKEVVS
jgi:two-component sensor histidine kinase/CheY-like chemotaxis protein